MNGWASCWWWWWCSNSVGDVVEQVVWSVDNSHSILLLLQPQRPWHISIRRIESLWPSQPSLTSTFLLPGAKTPSFLFYLSCVTQLACMCVRSILQWITHWKTDRQTVGAHARQVQTQHPPPIQPPSHSPIPVSPIPYHLQNVRFPLLSVTLMLNKRENPRHPELHDLRGTLEGVLCECTV